MIAFNSFRRLPQKDQAPVIQHAGSVANIFDVLSVVGNKNDSLALCAKLINLIRALLLKGFISNR